MANFSLSESGKFGVIDPCTGRDAAATSLFTIRRVQAGREETASAKTDAISQIASEGRSLAAAAGVVRLWI